MDFYIDRKTNRFTAGIGITSVVSTASFKARDTVVLDVWICNGAVPVDLSEGALLVFALKESVASAAPLLASAQTWVKIETGHYRASLSLNTVALNLALGDDAALAAFAELTWSEDVGLNWQSTNTLKAAIANDLYKGVEGVPLDEPAPDDWLEARRPAPLVLTAPPEDGVTAATRVGQLAIVTTTNDLSGADITHRDVWTCAALPSTWTPPGNIHLDRVSGDLMRVFVSSGALDAELAYP